MRGFGFFEALRTYGRKPFHLENHLARLRNAANRFGVRIPYSDATICRAIDTLITKNVPKNKDAKIRILLTGGRAINMIEFDPKHPTFSILVDEYAPPPRIWYTRGSSLLIQEFERQFPEYKTTNYIEAVSLQAKRKKVGAIEILYVTDGSVRECSTSNIFIVKKGRLITPEKGILKGVTRKVVLEEARRAHVPTEERDVSVKELYNADEAFITSSFKEVAPIVKIGGRKIGSGSVGAMTKRAMTIFHETTLHHKNF